MTKIIKEFKEFAISGNVFDMAIGIIIGTAFGKVVSSLVNDILMPPVGYLLGKVNFHQLAYTIQPEVKDAQGNVIAPEVAIRYGAFIETTLDFLLIALCIFFVIKLINRLRKKAEDTEDASVPTPKHIQVLSEIRDLLERKP